jgi:hypothetical protein
MLGIEQLVLLLNRKTRKGEAGRRGSYVMHERVDREALSDGCGLNA